MSQQWLLIVYDGRGHDIALHKLKLFPSKNKAGQYLGFYALSARALLESHIAALRALGLHGIAKKVEQRPPTRSFKRPKQIRQPRSAEIVNIEIARENRVAHDALKIAREKRRQAELLAERDTNNRARQALRRAKGEM